MKRFLLILAAFLGILSCGKEKVFPIIHTGDPEEGDTGPVKDDPDDVNWAAAIGYVFDASVIPEIHISVTKEQWNALLAAYDKDHDTREFVVCDVEYRKGSELRLKGNTSRRRPYEGGKYRHVHFGLNLHRNHEDPEHTVKGVRRMDLKWFKDDPAYVREIYCYDLFRRFGVWTAVHDVYARLWLKVGDETGCSSTSTRTISAPAWTSSETRAATCGSASGPHLWPMRTPAWAWTTTAPPSPMN